MSLGDILLMWYIGKKQFVWSSAQMQSFENIQEHLKTEFDEIEFGFLLSFQLIIIYYIQQNLRN